MGKTGLCQVTMKGLLDSNLRRDIVVLTTIKDVVLGRQCNHHINDFFFIL